MSGVYVAMKLANVRAAPATDAKVVAKLAVDQAVDATGQVAGGDWLRISVKGKTGFVSSKLMAASDADEVAAWAALKGAPTEASAKTFLADYPSGYFRPKAEALLAKLQTKKVAPATTATAEAVAPAKPVVVPQPTAPAATQQAAVASPPGTSILRISGELREDVERFIENSRRFAGKHRFLAINVAGDKIGTFEIEWY